jgi:hypothetical protein
MAFSQQSGESLGVAVFVVPAYERHIFLRFSVSLLGGQTGYRLDTEIGVADVTAPA